MRVFAFLNGLFEGIRPEIFIAAGIVLLAVDCLIAFRAERETVFAALALFTGGLCFLPALISSRFSDADTMVYGLLLLVIGSFFYLLLLAFLKIKETRRARNFGYSRKTDPYPRGYAGHPRNPEGRDCLGTAHPFDNRASPRARRHRGRLAFQSAYLAVILRMAERQSFRSRISFAVRRFLVA